MEQRAEYIFMKPCHTKIYKGSRVVFSLFFDFRGNLGNVKEKRARKTCFSREMKRLALRVYLAKFYKGVFL